MSTVIHQINTVTPGMSYVVQCGEKTVMIDGGSDGGDAEQLLDYLKKITGQNVPVVDAWFLTHAHPDHVFCLKGIAERYPDRIRVRKLIASFPPEEILAVIEPAAVAQMKRFYTAIENLAGLERVEPKAGDVFTFEDAKFEILLTWKEFDLSDGMTVDINDTSTVFRLTASGQTVLFLGDASKGADKILIEKFGSALKSDVVQLAHHGCYGSTIETYRIIDPDIVLWPSPLDTVKEMIYIVTVDRQLLDEPLHIKDFVIHGDGTRALEMPIRPSVAPREIKCYFPDEKLLTSSSGSVPILDDCPDPLDPLDKRWEKASLFVFETYAGTRNGVFASRQGAALVGEGEENASVSLCASDKGLLVRILATGVDCSAGFDPSHSAVSNCFCARLHFCEDHMDNFDRNWEQEFSPSEFRDLKLFPDPKIINGKSAYNSMPDRFESAGKVFDGGFAVSVLIPFTKKHTAGDIIGLHAEVNFIRSSGGPRAVKFMLNCMPYPERYRIYPGGVRWFELVNE
ncbi:MAG: MBL fold metallo-hydrolase [Clostridia bacterium]|nr:MBL fold metallo-hydrolase [Clostridia bacterium]